MFMTLCERSLDRSLTELSQGLAVPVIGLIGGIASGKSEVARLLAARGVIVINADAVGHQLLDDPEVRSLIVDRFGERVLQESTNHGAESSHIDRGALASIVFADVQARRALEAILHPRMRERFVATIAAAREGGDSSPCGVALDAAILLEAGWDDLCDLVVFVDAPRAQRLDRATSQRGWSPETFQSREEAQWPCDVKRRRADLVISNDGDLDLLRQQVDRLHHCLVLSATRSVVS
jgi:dephospho-CoA kinase